MSETNYCIMSSISAGFVKRENKILMVQNQQGVWSVPQTINESGELSSETAVRAVKEQTQADCSVERYKKDLKTTCKEDGEELNWQPYVIDMKEDPKQGKWISIKELEDLEISAPLEENLSQLSKRL